jgi:putative ABC transport system substrate-binding protein
MVAAGLPAFALGQAGSKPGRVPRIGYLILQSVVEPPSRERQAFLDGLRELGYVPGRNIEIVYASAEGDEDFLPEVCAELVRKKVDMIVTAGGASTAAAHAATRSLPLVFLALGDPVGIGMVKSLSRPGANVTGVSFVSTDLAGKRVQLMKDLLPKVKRVSVMWNPKNPNAVAERDAVKAAAKTLGLGVHDVAVGSSRDLDEALMSFNKRKPEALYVTFEGGLLASRRSDIVQFGLRQRVAVVSGWTSMTEAGGLFSYSPDIPLIFRRAAYYVHRILQGTPPGDLPIEMPTKVEFVINLQTARAIGVPVPDSMLLRVDRVIN